MSFLAIVKRELTALYDRKPILIFAVAGPVVLSLIMIMIMWHGVIASVPIVVLDYDDSAYSRKFLSLLNASNSVTVTQTASSEEMGLKMIKQGKVNGMLVIPENFEKDILAGKHTTITGRYNNQFMTQGGTMNKAFAETVGTFAASYSATRFASAGVPPSQIPSYIMPIKVANNLLFNYSLNYAWFLLLGIIPAMWQLFCIGTSVYMVGVDVHNKSAIPREYLDNSTLFLMGKLTPYILLMFLQLTFLLLLLFTMLGIDIRGSLLLVLLGGFLFTVGTVSMAALLASALGELSIAVAASSVYVAPAFAYAGITFPMEAMPLFAKIWGQLLPVTHFHKVIVDEVLRGSPLQVTLLNLASLALFTLILFPLAAILFKRKVSNG